MADTTLSCAQTKARIKVANARADFVKRLFAVALSVGFASQMVSLAIFKVDFSFSSLVTDAKPIWLLVIALIAVVTSWEGYHYSIIDKPLLDRPRFYLDVLIVFEYLALTLVVKNPSSFFTVLAIIFATYTLWDAFAVLAFVSRYKDNRYKPSVNVFWNIYLYGLLRFYKENNKANFGPGITLAWAGYIVALVLLRAKYLADDVFVTGFLILAAIIAYRLDKNYRWSLLNLGAILCIMTIIPLGLILCRTQIR